MENDLFNELVQINASLNSGLLNLSQGINAVLIQQQFTNAALVEKIAQEKTMICELEQIASRTCELLSEAHMQTALQRSTARDVLHLLGSRVPLTLEPRWNLCAWRNFGNRSRSAVRRISNRHYADTSRVSHRRTLTVSPRPVTTGPSRHHRHQRTK